MLRLLPQEGKAIDRSKAQPVELQVYCRTADSACALHGTMLSVASFSTVQQIAPLGL